MMRIITLLIVLLIAAIDGKPLEFTDDEPACGYDACPTVDHDKISVHIVAHSHDDVGWLYTVDEYYYNKVQFIISSVVSALQDHPERRYIQVETAFFYMWWKLQSDLVKSQVKQLINEGRLEVINGAWSMNDEAATHYQSVIDQYTLGLKFLQDNLGKCARPKVSWQVDPFGHSREQASLLSQFGMDAVFLGRIDIRDRSRRIADGAMEMLWTGSANLGSDSNIFTSVLHNLYGSPSGYCFDIICSDEQINVDPSSPGYNWPSRVSNFAQAINDIVSYYPTRHLLVPMGGDFEYKAAYNYFINIDRLIEGFKVFNQTIDDKEVNIMYSTPSCYTKAVYDYMESQSGTLEVKTDDFFPYAEYEYQFWTGYFTSRPSSKRLERFAHNLLQVSQQITTLGRKNSDINLPLSQAMGIMQHHDAITGTEKAAVEKDYHRLVIQGMNLALSNVSNTLSEILGMENDLNLQSCLLTNVSICNESDKDEFTVLIYNPLARKASHYIQIPVNDGTWKLTGPSGEIIANQLTDPIRDFSYISEFTSQKYLPKVLIFRAEDLPPLGYKVYQFQRVNSESSPRREEEVDIDQIGFSDRYINFDSDTSLLKSITLNGVTMNVSQEIRFYSSSFGSGAYVFEPQADCAFGKVTSTVSVNDGDLIREVKQIWNDIVKLTQIVRVYKEEDFIEFDWVIGPIDMSDSYGKEIIARYTTELDSNDEFYTDSNGREMIRRRRNFQPTYNYTDDQPQAGNYFPVNTKIVIKDTEREFAVLTDRSEGGSSLKSGQVELMLSRALMYDGDNKGVAENLNEYEYDQPLVTRGSHFVTFGNSLEGNDGRTMAAVERDIAQRKLLQPWVFFTSEDIPLKEVSYLQKELPQNVHLLTLQSWDSSENTLLLRFEHILEKGEDPVLSQEVTIDVSELFSTLHIVSMKEYLLAANTPLEESTKLKWSQITESESESSPLSFKNRLSRDETDLKITLAPMQIRTFIAVVQD
ncbi:hypothetical protein NQ318_012297 [Aromia moschata]|uniref:Alpha-mannosidase n=1 Tax=Aromia moschata TaxID=1265417 RepID=A0AAV8YLN0_9CUCU|nr:hypothetical protein NQ318_012297 [Aromia moschata]